MDTGTLIGARYRLERRLATGGMGAVWLAHDELLGRRVALKVLHQNLAAEEGFRRRFHAEARAAARLSHPGVVAVFDYGEDGDATFLAMELVQGESLHELLRRRAPLTPEETMRIVSQAADALAEAHAHTLVHRDVKPANLLVGASGTVKVTDFGIARAVDLTTATLDGSVLGTVAYMSPEQIRGEKVGSASDVYSLGVVAYESLAGARPFPAQESIAVALSHLHDPVPPLSDSVPAPVAALVTSMLGKNPADRPTARRVAERSRQLAVALHDGGPETMPLAALALGGAGTAEGHGATSAVGAVGAASSASPPASPTPDSTRPTPVRTLGAALGAAAIAARSRDARRHPSAGVIFGLVVVALALGLLLAVALPGSGPGAKAPTGVPDRSAQHTTAANDPASSTTTSSSSTTTTSSSTTSTTAAPTPTSAPGPGQGPPGGTGPPGNGPHGTGPPGNGPHGTGPSGQTKNGPATAAAGP